MGTSSIWGDFFSDQNLRSQSKKGHIRWNLLLQDKEITLNGDFDNQIFKASSIQILATGAILATKLLRFKAAIHTFWQKLHLNGRSFECRTACCFKYQMLLKSLPHSLQAHNWFFCRVIEAFPTSIGQTTNGGGAGISSVADEGFDSFSWRFSFWLLLLAELLLLGKRKFWSLDDDR